MARLGLVSVGMDRLTIEVKSQLSNDMLTAGLALQQSGKVISVSASASGYILNGKVQDGEDRIWEVVLDSEIFRLTRCSCEANDYCEHIAAVFLQAYVLEGRDAGHYISKRTPTRQSYIEDVKARRQTAAATALPTNRRQIAPKAITPSQSAAEWHDAFKERLTEANWRRKGALHSVYTSAEAQFAGIPEEWDPHLRVVFHLHLYFYLLDQLERRVQSSDPYDYYESLQARSLSHETMNNIVKLIIDEDWDKIFKEHPQRYNEIKNNLIRQTFRNKPALADWNMIYRFCWGRIFPQADAAEEVSRLQRALEQSAPGSPAYDAIVTALVHFDITAGDDQSAFARLATAGSGRDPFSMSLYLNTFRQFKQWDRLLQWLTFLFPDPNDPPEHEDAAQLFEYWVAGNEANPGHSAWRHWISVRLDALFDFYEAYLQDTRQYKEWVDIYLCTGNLPDFYSMQFIDKWLRHKPSLLLPIYHRVIEYYVSKKNRESYRNAVELLQSLKKIYHQLKKNVVWDKYMAQLSERTARMRVFHEELRKGKLIP